MPSPSALSNFSGPLAGDTSYMGGLFKDAPLAVVDSVFTNYKVIAERFDIQIASGATALATLGATVTDINAATAPTQSVTGADRYLLINPGTKADSGTEVQFNVAPSAVPPIKTIGPITSTTTLMLNKELFWFSRVGFISNTAGATGWDGKAVLGWAATDASLMDPATGVLTIGSGGGIGFHVGEDGTLSYWTKQATGTTFSTSLGINLNPVATAGAVRWFDLGFRARWPAAHTSQGSLELYVNGSITRASALLSMSGILTSSVSYGIHNGPSAQLVDLAVESIVTGISRANV